MIPLIENPYLIHACYSYMQAWMSFEAHKLDPPN